MEAQPEEEESVELRGETTITAEQLRGRFLFISDHSVTQIRYILIMVMKPMKHMILIALLNTSRYE